MEPWIKLYRKFVEWEWYGDINCKVVFLHLLLTANWKPKKWQGKVIDVGELVTSIPMLAESVCLSEQQTRTALTKLEASRVITRRATNKYTIIKVLNYCIYQSSNIVEQQTNEQTNNIQITDKQHSNNRQITAPKELKNNRSIEDIDNRCCCINNINNINMADVPIDMAAASKNESGKVFSDYEQNIGVLSPMVVEVLKDRITAQGAALVSLAIVEAVKNNAKTIRYIESILNAWECDGIKTVDAAKLRISGRVNKSKKNKASGSVANSSFRNYPDGYDLSDDEKKRLEKMMDEYC